MNGSVKFLEYSNAQTNETQKQHTPKTIALRFNDCINNRDLTGLCNMMTDDHVFIDSANNCVTGKANNKENWSAFFDLFPDYQNIFECITSIDSTVIMQGYSVCSDKILNNSKAIWVAQIVDDKLKEWRIYLDNEENRKNLGIIGI